MAPMILQNLRQVHHLCEQFGLQKMFLFGSAVIRKNFTSESDVDLLYKMKPEISALEIDLQPDFFEMLFSFEDLFGRKVDLIDLTTITNPYFIPSVNQRKLKIYEA